MSTAPGAPHVHHTRIGDGPCPVVMLHGLFGQGKNFTSIAKALVAADPSLSCWLLDLPNHGRSDWTDSASYEPAAAAIAAKIEQLSPEPVALLGHSMGGKVAMLVALTRPELVERLVVVDIAPVDSSATGSSNAPLVAAMRDLDLDQLPDRSTADRELSARVPDPVVRGFLMQNLRRSSGPEPHWSWQMNLAVLGDQLDEIAAWPATSVAPYPGPTLWITGQRSPYVGPEHREPMRALFPRVRAVSVKDAGHWVHSEQPKAFVQIVDLFLHQDD